MLTRQHSNTCQVGTLGTLQIWDQPRAECGIEEEPYICLSAEQSSVKSTKDLGHVHGLYATRKEATTRSQDSKDGRKLVQILRLIKVLSTYIARYFNLSRKTVHT